MSDTYTTFLQELEPKDREQLLEAFFKARLQSIDRAIAGYTSVSLASLSGNVDLSPLQAKHRVIKLTGAPSGAVTVRIPHDTGANADIIFVNTCSGSNSTVTFKSTGANTGNSAGVPLATGLTRTVRHDGESAYPVALSIVTASGRAPGASAYHSTSQSLVHNTSTALALNSERFDTIGMHDTVTNNSRLTCKVAGLYHVSATVAFAANGTGLRQVVIRLNGTTAVAAQFVENIGATFDVIVGCDGIVQLAEGDYVEVEAFQTSGGSLNVTAANNYSPVLSAVMKG